MVNWGSLEYQIHLLMATALFIVLRILTEYYKAVIFKFIETTLLILLEATYTYHLDGPNIEALFSVPAAHSKYIIHLQK